MSNPQPPKLPAKLVTLLGECRELGTRCQSGDPADSCIAFAELTDRLLRTTVLADKQPPLAVKKVPGGSGASAIGKPGESLRLRNDWFLRVLLTFVVEPSVSAGGAMKLKTLSQNVQYLRDCDNEDSWVFRYEYFRVAPNHYAPGHLHVRGSTYENCLGPKGKLEDIHFPTGRVTLESIIRMLIDDFNVPSKVGEDIWRPLLHATERNFITIARQPEAMERRKPNDPDCD